MSHRRSVRGPFLRPALERAATRLAIDEAARFCVSLDPQPGVRVLDPGTVADGTPTGTVANSGSISMGELRSLKHKWGSSMSAWIRRMAEYTSVMKDFRVNSWLKREPGEQLQPEKTERFERLVKRAVAEDIISMGRAADFLNKPLSEVRRELAWPEGEVSGA